MTLKWIILKWIAIITPTALVIAISSWAVISLVIKPYADKKDIPALMSIHASATPETIPEELKKVDSSLIAYDETKRIGIDIKLPSGISVDPENRIYITKNKSLILIENDSVAREIPTDWNLTCVYAVNGNLVYVGCTDHMAVYDGNFKLLSSWESLGNEAFISSIAVAGSNVFVADAGNREIIRYGEDGIIINKIIKKNKDTNKTGFMIPGIFFDVAIGADGNLWTTNPGNVSLEVFAFDGKAITSWENETLFKPGEYTGCCNPTQLVALPDGSILTGEKGVNKVKVYDAHGKLTCLVAAPSMFASDTKIADIAVDGNGRVLVLDPSKKALRIFEKKNGAS